MELFVLGIEAFAKCVCTLPRLQLSFIPNYSESTGEIASILIRWQDVTVIKLAIKKRNNPLKRSLRKMSGVFYYFLSSSL